MTNIPSSTIGAGLSILALGAWLTLGQPGGSGGAPDAGPGSDPLAELPTRPLPEPAEGTGGEQVAGEGSGSAVPCAVPLAWRIARVDEGFGLSDAEARAAFLDAAAAWEAAAERTLFENDPTWGFPVRFIHDERQVATREQERAELAYRRESTVIDSVRNALEEASREETLRRERYQERVQAFEQRVTNHNVAVREWNRQGGAPAAVVEELEATSEAIAAERRELEETGRALEDAARELEEEEARFNRRVEEHNRLGEELERSFPTARVQSGLYREATESDDGRIVSVQREIRIFRFSDPGDLRLVIAHELGHALGLGHAEVAGAVMSAEYTRTTDPGSTTEGLTIQPADVELLRNVCPDL